MKILVLHAWLKGNLGDVLQLSVLLSALRELKPGRLDLAGFPSRPAPETGEVLQLADGYLPDTFPWYWAMAPATAGTFLFQAWWRARRPTATSAPSVSGCPGRCRSSTAGLSSWC